MKISVYGLGQFGYAFLKHLDTRPGITYDLYGYDSVSEVVVSLRETREHAYLYKGHKISENVHISDNPAEILKDADIVVVSVPSHITRAILPFIKTHAKKDVILMNTAKALDYESGKRLSVLFREELHAVRYSYALFAGGTIAADFFNNQLLGAVISSEQEKTALLLKDILETDTLRLTVNTDLDGTEYASAFKNVISILAGIVAGKGYSYGSETFIISRAAQEVENLIISELHGKKETFAVGSQCWGNDMFMSATGSTRNREYGILLGKGMSPDDALETMLSERKTVEGVKTLESLYRVTRLSRYPLLHYLYLTVIGKEETDLLSVISTI